MTHFYVRACPEGHYEIDIRPARAGQICTACGGQLIDRCPAFGEYIMRWNIYGTSMMIPRTADDYELPDTCPKCGASLPWRGKDKVRVPNRQGR